MRKQAARFLSSLRILHLALFAGQCLLLILAVWIVTGHHVSFAERSTDKLLQVLSLLLSFAIAYGAVVMKKRRLEEIRAGAASVEARVARYRSSCLLQWALLETVVLLNLVCFIVTGNYAFVALTVAVMIFYALQAPTRLAVLWQLGITEEALDAL